MSRKERKEKDNKKQFEIADSLRKYMKEVADDISDEEIKADPHRRWVHILTEGNLWVQKKMKLFPQEAHMYRSAAYIVKNAILEALKDGKQPITREEES